MRKNILTIIDYNCNLNGGELYKYIRNNFSNIVNG